MAESNLRHNEIHHILRNAVFAENGGHWMGMRNTKQLQNGFITIDGPYKPKGIEIIKSIIPFETSMMVINGELIWHCWVMLKRSLFRGSGFIYDVEVDHISHFSNRRINDIIYQTPTTLGDRFGISVPPKRKTESPTSDTIEEPF